MKARHITGVMSSVLIVIILGSGLQGRSARVTVSFNDPGNAHGAYYNDITRCVRAAAAMFLAKMDHSLDNLKIQITFTNRRSTDAASVTSSLLKRENGRRIYEQGTSAALKGNLRSNKPFHLKINISKKALKRYWFDPSPMSRTAVIPRRKTDAVSTFLHEMGHALAFSGWLNKKTGMPRLRTGDISAYDQWVRFEKGMFYFTGPNAVAVYGGRVPLHSRNYTHYGNRKPKAGHNLENYLMFGPYSKWAFRKKISKLDLAIMKDCGLPVK